MYSATDESIQTLLREWHEAERLDFTKRYPNLDYEREYAKLAIDRKKYIALDEGTARNRSGVFLVERETGAIYRIKAYGVPHLRKKVGVVDQVKGYDLYTHRYW